MASAFPGIYIYKTLQFTCLQYQRDSAVDLETGSHDARYVVGHIMVLYSPHWTNIGFFSFILRTVNLFRYPTRIVYRL